MKYRFIRFVEWWERTLINTAMDRHDLIASWLGFFGNSRTIWYFVLIATTILSISIGIVRNDAIFTSAVALITAVLLVFLRPRYIRNISIF